MSEKKNPVAAAADKVVEKVQEAVRPGNEIPGAPGPVPPPVDEPTEPGGPLPPKPDQHGPGHVQPDRPGDRDPAEEGRAGRRPPHHRPGRAPVRHRPLAEGRSPRPGAASGPSPAGEDHPFRPRTHPRAGRARPGRRRSRRVPGLRRRRGDHQGRLPRRGRRDAGVRALLHRPGLTRIGRHGARHPGLRDEVLHRRGRLRPGRQQHPGVLHPGRDQVPRCHPRGQAASGPGDPAGAERSRHVLGLRHAPHRGDPPHPVEHVRPGHPAFLPDDGRLRRPHLPAGQRRGRHHTGEVPLEAEAGCALAGVGGGADHRGRGSRLPPP